MLCWTEQKRIKLSAKGLCKALCRIMVTCGFPVEISSDGDPELAAKVTKDYFKRWGVFHCMSSAYHPISNGRVELTVKSTNRLLMESYKITKRYTH